MKEPIVCIAERGKSLRARISIQSTVQRLSGLDVIFPAIEAIGVGFLEKEL